MMKREVRRLMRIAKEIVPHKTYKKLRAIKEIQEQYGAVRFAIFSALEKEYFTLEKRFLETEDSMKNSLLIKSRILTIPSKLKFVKVDFQEKEIGKLRILYKSIKKELENVRAV